VHVYFALYSLVLEVGVKGPYDMPQKISLTLTKCDGRTNPAGRLDICVFYNFSVLTAVLDFSSLFDSV
jgi:hypothetical protein